MLSQSHLFSIGGRRFPRQLKQTVPSPDFYGRAGIWLSRPRQVPRDGASSPLPASSEEGRRKDALGTGTVPHHLECSSVREDAFRRLVRRSRPIWRRRNTSLPADAVHGGWLCRRFRIVAVPVPRFRFFLQRGDERSVEYLLHGVAFACFPGAPIVKSRRYD
jgi:hypothetical protein